MPIIPALWEAEVGESSEGRTLDMNIDSYTSGLQLHPFVIKMSASPKLERITETGTLIQEVYTGTTRGESALWEAEVNGSLGQEFKTNLANMVNIQNRNSLKAIAKNIFKITQ
ncbi:hypothetical protein AAY473_024296 [Plecturocebus cupreus]